MSTCPSPVRARFASRSTPAASATPTRSRCWARWATTFRALPATRSRARSRPSATASTRGASGSGWWFGGCDFTCEACRRGDFISCANGQVPGISYDGGYAEYMVAPAEAPARLPDDLSDVDAAPLLCAGITTFNALRNSVARPGDRDAILGVGGLGHLGIQYAAKMGFEVVAIARGEEKGPLARELGAHHYVDSTASDVAQALTRLGGAQVAVATVT